MFYDLRIQPERPTEPQQLLHLADIDHYFENQLHTRPIEEAMMMNYIYGVSYTKNFQEFCNTMHTCLYWMNEKYSYLCQIDKASDAINLATEIEKGGEVDDDAYRYDLLFGAWLSFVNNDSLRLRAEFLDELSGMAEDEFIRVLASHNCDPAAIETFCVAWIKKMVDPCKAAGYGHYMMYFMIKTITILKARDENISFLDQALTALYIYTQSSSRQCTMSEHQLPMN